MLILAALCKRFFELQIEFLKALAEKIEGLESGK